MSRFGKIFGGFVIGGGLLYAILKGSSLFNFYKQLSITPKIDGGLKKISIKLSKVIIPVAIEFENHTDQEITVAITNLVLKYNDKSIGYLKPNSQSVKIAKNQVSTLTGLKIEIPYTSLVQNALATTTSFDVQKIINAISADVQFILNNSIVCDCTQKFGETSDMDTNGNTKSVKGLGVTASHQRNLKPFKDYEMYIPPKSELYNKNLIIFPNGDVNDTVALMKKVAREFAPDTEMLARHLEASTDRQTIQNIFDFVYNYIQYVPDSTTTEQVRRPLRTLWDRRGDCDCFATLIGSILTNLNIPFKFRIAAYNGRSNFQHVYVIIPRSSGYWTCDPVLDECFYEKPATKTMDF